MIVHIESILNYENDACPAVAGQLLNNPGPTVPPRCNNAPSAR
jgi:hypothetical protein